MKNSSSFLLFLTFSVLACKHQHTEKKFFPQISQFDVVSDENLALEHMHREMLEPIMIFKSSNPKIYWFIVSWLNTNYKTPNWKGYGEKDWQNRTKERGIDCSGFARVMQDQIFNKKIRGGSQGILNKYCNKKDSTNLMLGDLLFFRAPYARNDRIVHVGVYLLDRYFVHVTSKKSAALSLGLSINSLDEKNWSNEFVVAGEVKE